MKKAIVVMFIVMIGMMGCGKKAPQMSASKKLLIEGQVYLQQGDVQKALESFSASIQEDPKNIEGYYILAEVLIHLKQSQVALSFLQTAAQSFPDQGGFYFLMGLAYDDLQQSIPAIVSVRKSLDLFTAQKDQVGAQRAGALLSGLIEKAKTASEEAAIQNAQNEAKKVEHKEELKEEIITPSVDE